ncbi:hypothetical protein ABC356_000475 [Salmonella enterica]|nr:hypothetical protein [Salmonella enterica]EDQ7381667.1 hypothetical protein [Salmonella enterica subsp. diarizonae serovar 35:l,v:z35]EBT2371811.1 hypothetical protein [Salmonella enterica]ECK6278215.1 hypothetical protein [Salmonella enterica]EDQ7909881.1 hypothetical protein [Salmonella enterica]
MENSLHYVNIKNKRDLRLFLWYLSAKDIAVLISALGSSKSVYNEGDIFGSNIEIASSAVNQALLLLKDNVVKGVYSTSFNYFKSLQLPSSEFSWIKKSPDACYFSWLYIKTMVHDSNSELQLIPVIAGKIRNADYTAVRHDFLYKRLLITPYPVDNKERMVAIEDFFDRAPTTLRNKINLMHRIRNKWNDLYYLSANFPLTPKEKKKCDWAWEYIQKDRSNMRGKRKKPDGTYSDCLNVPSETDSNMLSALRPSGAYEKYMAVKFSYIFKFVKDDLFIQRFKKAWGLHKYRLSAASKKNKLSRRYGTEKEDGVAKPVPSGSEQDGYKDFLSENSTRQFTPDLAQPLHSEHDTESIVEPSEAYQNHKNENVKVMKPTQSGSSSKGINPRGIVIKYLQSSSLKNTFPYQMISMASDSFDAIVKTASKIKGKKNIK